MNGRIGAQRERERKRIEGGRDGDLGEGREIERRH